MEMRGRNIDECKESLEMDQEGCTKESYWDLLTEEEEEDDHDVEEEEEEESPKSVVVMERRKKKKKGYVHSQVLRIRKEDSHLEDYKVVIRFKSMVTNQGYGRITYFDRESNKQQHEVVLLTAKPMLPCSPLSRKTTVN